MFRTRRRESELYPRVDWRIVFGLYPMTVPSLYIHTRFRWQYQLAQQGLEIHLQVKAVGGVEGAMAAGRAKRCWAPSGPTQVFGNQGQGMVRRGVPVGPPGSSECEQAMGDKVSCRMRVTVWSLWDVRTVAHRS